MLIGSSIDEEIAPMPSGIMLLVVTVIMFITLVAALDHARAKD
jgi:hypothetical protein